MYYSQVTSCISIPRAILLQPKTNWPSSKPGNERRRAGHWTRVPRNVNMEGLRRGYLFPEISVRENEHARRNPDARLIRLGIGDTTQPIPDTITAAMAEHAYALSTTRGYRGYGAEQGDMV
ncbi:hypothetical protein OIU76_007214 [Salix suchowensis]|nr:hypothetical protein OIU76_007214 [Salix suchowensis]